MKVLLLVVVESVLLSHNCRCLGQTTDDWMALLFPGYTASDPKVQLPLLPGSPCGVYRYKRWFALAGPNCTSLPSNETNVHAERIIIYNTQLTLLAPGDLDTWSNVQVLRITMNSRLLRIEPGALKRLSQLKTLIISENSQMESLSSTTFTGLLKLENLQLLRNNIENVNQFAQALSPDVLPNLNFLDISGNSINSIMKEDFQPMKDSNLKKLKIVMSKTSYIEPGSFKYLSNLEVLHLGGNDINSSVATEMIRSLKTSGSRLRELSLQGNMVNDNPHPLLKEIASSNITNIDLSDMRFGPLTPGFFPPMPNLQLLNMSGCMIDNLPDGVINNELMPHLKYLILARNQFSGILHTMAIPTLFMLDVSNNGGPTDLNTHFIISSKFVNMTSLVSLNLDNNDLELFHREQLKCCPNLKYLAMRSSYIHAIDEFSFENSSKLIYLDLSLNDFGSTSALTTNLFKGLANLVALDLSLCSIKSIPRDLFVHLQNLEFLVLKGNKFKSLYPETFNQNHHLKVIDFSYTNLNSWNRPILAPLSNLTYLFVFSCQLATITPAMVADFSIAENLDISKNSITCDCTLYENILHFLSTNKNFPLNGSQNACFTPSKYHGVSIREFWENARIDKSCYFIPTGLKILIGMGCTTFVLLISVIFYFHYKWELIYWTYKLKSKFYWLNCNICFKNTTIPNDYKYDAFISYSHEDKKFVTKLKAILEGEYKMKLCVYDRDFCPGELITEAVLESVASSRKTIMVLSESFAKSHWCLWELQIAQQRALFFRKANPDSLIIVKLADIDESLMTYTLKHLMNTRIYIEWSPSHSKQRVFWQKLKAAIDKN